MTGTAPKRSALQGGRKGTTNFILTLMVLPAFLLITIFHYFPLPGVVIAFSARLTERSVGTTRMLFLAYALITGLTFSVIGLLYDARSIMFAFGITAIYYGALAVIGYTTRINLMKFGPLLYISLIVLIISEIVLALMGTSGDTMLLTSVC